jgi:hypothetical protein
MISSQNKEPKEPSMFSPGTFVRGRYVRYKEKQGLLPEGQVDTGVRSNVIMGNDEDTGHQTGFA